MQKTILRALILAIVLTAPFLFAENGIGLKQLPEVLPAPASDRITSAVLNKQKSTFKSGFHQARWSEQAPAGKISHYDIYKDSIILQQGNTYTVLPPSSIVYLPDSLEKKVVTHPHGAFVPWPQFYLNNRSWIFTHSINLKQAQGAAPLKKGIHQQFKRINRLVVAIHQHNPISILKASQVAE